MYKIGLKIHESSPIKVKMTNNRRENCIRVIKNLKVSIFDVSLPIDFYVMTTKGDGYPLILGHPWLIFIKAIQRWDKGQLMMQPKGKRAMIYDIKEGKQRDIRNESLSGDEIEEEDLYSDEEFKSSQGFIS